MISPSSDSYPRPYDLDPISERARLRSRFKWVAAIWLAVLFVTPICALYLNIKGGEMPRRSVRMSNGIWLTADARDVRGSKEDFLVNVKEIVESYFFRTEKGGVPEIAPYVHPAVLDDMEAKMKRVSRDHKSYLQELVIADIKNVGGDSTFQGFLFHGYLRSRNSRGYVNNEVFYGIRFRKIAETEGNAMGWWLTDIGPSSREVFFKDEIEAQVREATTPKSAREAPVEKSKS